MDTSQQPSKAHLTKTLIDGLALSPDGRQYAVMDTELKGFGVRVGKSSKTFIVFKRLPHGAPKRVTLGKYGPLTVIQARKLAQEQLAALVQGIDVNAKKKSEAEEKKKDVLFTEQTFGWLLKTYKEEHLIKHKGAKEGTLRSFRDTMTFFEQREITLLEQVINKKGTPEGITWKEGDTITLNSWLDRPFREITSKEVLERHDYFAKAKPSRLIGGVLQPMQRTHQIAFKFAQASFNFIAPRMFEETGETVTNPFDILKTFKRWSEVKKRTRMIDFMKVEEIGAWFEAVKTYSKESPVVSDYILFSLLQAGRSIELWGLTWDKVDFEKKSVTYTNTKNGKDYTFPMTTLVEEILKRRQESNPSNIKWVWHYPASKTGHIPKSIAHHFEELTKLGAKFVSSHDLRRTWATAANFLKHQEREINYLLKHTDNDINAHYIIRQFEIVKGILQDVEDLFVRQHQAYLEKMSKEASK